MIAGFYLFFFLVRLFLDFMFDSFINAAYWCVLAYAAIFFFCRLCRNSSFLFVSAFFLDFVNYLIIYLVAYIYSHICNYSLTF